MSSPRNLDTVTQSQPSFDFSYRKPSRSFQKGQRRQSLQKLDLFGPKGPEPSRDEDSSQRGTSQRLLNQDDEPLKDLGNRRRERTSDQRVGKTLLEQSPVGKSSEDFEIGKKQERPSAEVGKRPLAKRTSLMRKMTYDPSRVGPQGSRLRPKENLEDIERRVFAQSKIARESQFSMLGKGKEEQIIERIKKLESNPVFNKSPRNKKMPVGGSSGRIPSPPSKKKTQLELTQSPIQGQAAARNRSKSLFFNAGQLKAIIQAESQENEHGSKREWSDMTVSPPTGSKRVIGQIGMDPSILTSGETSHEVSVKLDEEEEGVDLNQRSLRSRNLQRIKRMTYREKKKSFLIYPESDLKASWDLFMTVVLLTSCILTPVDIAFKQTSMESDFFVKLIVVMDILFAVDIVVIFNACYYDDQVRLVEDRKEIARNYLKGWFAIDLFAILPFEMLVSAATEFNQYVRVARVGRLYKLVKLTRLLRILKIMRDRSRLLRYLHDFLKVGLGFERLFFFLIIFLLMCHIASCLWITIAGLQNENGFDGTWMEDYMKDGSSGKGIYLTAFYWTATTITTVGYGDITGTNSLERFFCSLMMLVGVIAFSFANGSLASIISNYDQTNAEYQEKIVVLNKIYKDYCLPLDLYIRLKQSLAYENQKVINDFNKFVEDLPHKLKVEVSLYIYEDRYNKLKLFRGQSAAFISWLCPLFRPQFFGDNQYIFQEGDEITGIYFLISGQASYVLPSFDNTPYISIQEGDHFGLLDIIGSSETQDFKLEDWYATRNRLQRQFSVSSVRTVELQALSLQDLYRLQQEFVGVFEMMVEHSVKQLRAAWIMKLDAMQKCNALQEQLREESDESVALSAGSLEKRVKKISYNIEVRNLDQINEEDESQSLSSVNNSKSEESDNSFYTLSPASQDRVKKRLTEDFSNSNAIPLPGLHKSQSLNKMLPTPVSSGAHSASKKFDLQKSKSLYIDKKELLSSQPKKDANEMREEGQLVLKKLENHLKDKFAKKAARKSADRPHELSTSKKSNSNMGEDSANDTARRLSNRPSLNSNGGKTNNVSPKKVQFGEAQFISSSEESASSSARSLSGERSKKVAQPRVSNLASPTVSYQLGASEPNEVSTLQALVPELKQEVQLLREQLQKMKSKDTEREAREKKLSSEVENLKATLVEEMRSLKAFLKP